MVGISLLTLVPGEFGGSETYVQGLLRGLRETGSHEYRVLLPPAAPDAAAGLPSVVAPYRLARTRLERLAAMGFATARPKPLRALLEDADVVHYPLTIRIPSGLEPSVVTLHDVQHLDLPQLFGRGERGFRAIAWHRSLRAAERVVVPSGFVRDRAIAKLGLEPARIEVVHSGVDHERFTPGSAEREAILLYPARRWPHKNHDRLFEAFAQLRVERPELRLVLTGDPHVGASPDGVESLGIVSADELTGLYRRAAALVFPSLYEGFGQPPLEAMACGCPVACSRAASLPEVCGEAARLFDPEDPADMADAVSAVLEVPEPWVAAGLARAAAFTWERAAGQYEDVYRELLAG